MCYIWRHLMSIFYIYFHRVAVVWSFFDRIARCNRCAASPCLPPVDNSAGSGYPTTFPRRSRRPNSPMNPDLPPGSPRPRQSLNRDNIAAFSAKSVSMIFHQHDYRTIRIGYFDRRSSMSRRCPVSILRGSSGCRAAITIRRGRCLRGGRELSAVGQSAVTPRTASCHGACNPTAMVLQARAKPRCNAKCSVVAMMLQHIPQGYVQPLCNGVASSLAIAL